MRVSRGSAEDARQDFIDKTCCRRDNTWKGEIKIFENLLKDVNIRKYARICSISSDSFLKTCVIKKNIVINKIYCELFRSLR